MFCQNLSNVGVFIHYSWSQVFVCSLDDEVVILPQLFERFGLYWV